MDINIKKEIEDPFEEHDEFITSEDKNDPAFCQVFVKCESVSSGIEDGSPSGTGVDQNIYDKGETSIKAPTGEPPFDCTICNKQFMKRHYLKRHMETHSGVKDFKCTICGKEFIRKRDLERHTEIHSDEESKQFKCPDCNKQFRRKDQLGAHMKMHIGIKEFKCTICDKEFMRKKALEIHTEIHSTVKKSKKFQCLICNKKFRRNDQLGLHMKAHAGIKDYRCPICNKEFLRKRSYIRHSKMYGHNSEEFSKLQIKVENEQMSSNEGSMNIKKEIEDDPSLEDTDEHYTESDIETEHREFVFVTCDSIPSDVQNSEPSASSEVGL